MAPPASNGQIVALPVCHSEQERSLISAARRGDEDAFRDLYLAYSRPIWNFINSLIGDPIQAQDVLQNVFFKAFRSLAGFRFQSGLLTWIYRIAHNECRNHLRGRGAATVPLGAVIGSREEVDRSHMAREDEVTRAALRAAVMDLPFKMREVIILKYMDELSYKEMSRILGCPAGTVASRLNRALAELEVRLRPFRGLL